MAIQPRYRTPGEINHPTIRPNASAQRAFGLRCRYRIRIEQNADLASEQIQQHRYALNVLHSLEQADAIGKSSVEETNLLARLKPRSGGEQHESVLALALAQALDHARRHR